MDFLTDTFDGDTLEWATLPIRLVLGFVFLDSGLAKFRRGIGGTGDWFAGLGLPFPQFSARLVASTELCGGALLLAGLFTHWVAIPLAVNMTVAACIQRFKLHAPFRGGDVQGYELDLLMVAGALTLALSGAGPLSLDRVIEGA